MKKICIIVGTRPEIIKASSIIKECMRRKIRFFLIHTNQHYAHDLDAIFFRDFHLPKPKYNLRVGSGSHSESTAKMLIGIEPILLREKPGVVIVVGDTNSALAGALAASKIFISIAHVEAGARSYDRAMPEEINRVVIDHLSDYLFTSVTRERGILLREGIAGRKIFTVGNTIVDSVMEHIKIVKKQENILKQLQLKKRRYFLITAHRQENVDSKKRFSEILVGLALLQKHYKIPLIYPIHPRSRKKMNDFKLKVSAGLILIDPVGYFDFLSLELNSLLVLTDSGGVQEECCVLGIPSVILRDNNEWPEMRKAGCHILVGANSRKIITGVKKMLSQKYAWENPLGDGKSGRRIISILRARSL